MISDAFKPWTPPFSYNKDGQWIQDSLGNRFMDLRGWGFLTGHGSQGLGMNEDKAADIQDTVGERVVVLLNVSAGIFPARE